MIFGDSPSSSSSSFPALYSQDTRRNFHFCVGNKLEIKELFSIMKENPLKRKLKKKKKEEEEEEEEEVMHNIIAKRAQNPFKYLSTQSLFKYEGPRDFFFPNVTIVLQSTK